LDKRINIYDLLSGRYIENIKSNIYKNNSQNEWLFK